MFVHKSNHAFPPFASLAPLARRSRSFVTYNCVIGWAVSDQARKSARSTTPEWWIKVLNLIKQLLGDYTRYLINTIYLKVLAGKSKNKKLGNCWDSCWCCCSTKSEWSQLSSCSLQQKQSLLSFGCLWKVINSRLKEQTTNWNYSCRFAVQNELSKWNFCFLPVEEVALMS